MKTRRQILVSRHQHVRKQPLTAKRDLDGWVVSVDCDFGERPMTHYLAPLRGASSIRYVVTNEMYHFPDEASAIAAIDWFDGEGEHTHAIEVEEEV